MTDLLPDAQVLAVLTQLDADLNTILSQRRGLAQIKQVYGQFVEAKKTLAELDTTIKKKEETLAGLDGQVKIKVEALMKNYNEVKAKYETELESLTGRFEETKRQLASADANLADKVKFAETRVEQVNAEIKAKTAELQKVKSEMQALRSKLA